MSKIIIVSNRLPVGINIEKNNISIKQNIGGLVTGMQSVYSSGNNIWIGWSGIDIEDISEEMRSKTNNYLRKEKYIPIHIDRKDIDQYYAGFSNRTIWPLFHYFTQFTEFEKKYWESYKRVNRLFADEVIKNIEKDDIVWIHDYHLLLLPGMIRKVFPEISIGFFLHIPFPSYEIFRILPWREELIKGMLGADLLGFHAFDYQRHFISCVRRLLGYEIVLNQITLENRIVQIDSFPMGIDYEKYHSAAQDINKDNGQRSGLQKEIDTFFRISPDRKIILSIDRLDYSKGIPNRIHAFEYFLDKYPEYREKVTLLLIVTPSRSDVPEYRLMKKEIDELVGNINGKYSTINWTPVWYFHRLFSFRSMVELYSASDIALISPLRDGMNLVAKEYIACKTDRKGVLILSEMAGSAKEMNEAIIVNPNNPEEIADSIQKAITMPEDDIIESNIIMQDRIKRYNVIKWANDFINTVNKTKELNLNHTAKKISPDIKEEIIKKYNNSIKRILFLDYDGTLVGFHGRPQKASPDPGLYDLLDRLASDEKNEIVLITGRDKETFDDWFGNKNYTLIVEHGVMIKEPGRQWTSEYQLNTDWKEIIRPAIEFYVDRTPGSFIEEKRYSLVWHFRKADPDLGNMKALELKDELTSLIANYQLDILEGNKVVEVKNSGINKGIAALSRIENRNYDLILGIGDDYTDEYLFEELPENAVSIRVGNTNTAAAYTFESLNDVRELLKLFAA